MVNLKEEVALAEDVFVLARGGRGFGELPPAEQLGDFAAVRPRETDKAFMVLAKQCLVHARLVVKALKVRAGNELYEVFVARFILREEHHVPALLVDAGLLVFAAPHRKVGMHANDRLYLGLFACHIKLNRAVEVAVVGEGERVVAVFLRSLD